MKNATRAPKRKLLGFAEQLNSTPAPAVPASVGLTRPPFPTGPQPAEAPVLDAVPTVAPQTKNREVLPAPIKAVSLAAKRKSGGGLRKLALIVLVVAAIVVAGPSLAILMGFLAYPLIIPAAIVGGLILFDSKRSKRK